jgi:hypothetical protein
MISGEDQVLRALRSLVRDGALMRLGYGVYARATRSRISGRLMVSGSNGFHNAALQAFDKLGVPWEQSDSTKAYNEGHSTQTPRSKSRRVSAGGGPTVARSFSLNGKPDPHVRFERTTISTARRIEFFRLGKAHADATTIFRDEF